MSSISNRWQIVQERVAAAATTAGRSPHEVTIVGVTKYVDVAQTRALVEAGCFDLGESRPQSLWEKAEALSDLPVRWHMIGHLQRNKSKRTVPLVHCIHSIDSLRIAEQINRDASDARKRLPVLLEVNVSGDASKTGLLPDELRRMATAMIELSNLQWIGLMGMAGLGNSAPRRDFAEIRRLRDELQAEVGSAADLRQLSMGMSGDFEEAIGEGATIIRLGSILYEG